MPSVSEFRRHLSALTEKVRAEGERVVVTSHGRPVYAVVPIDDLELLTEIDARDDAEDRALLAGEGEGAPYVSFERAVEELSAAEVREVRGLLEALRSALS
jgi:prevent-host-death family protein